MAEYIRLPMQRGAVMFAPGELSDDFPAKDKLQEGEREDLYESGVLTLDPEKIFDPVTGGYAEGVTGNAMVDPFTGRRQVEVESGKVLNDSGDISPALKELGYVVQEGKVVPGPRLQAEVNQTVEAEAKAASPEIAGTCKAVKRNGEPCPVRAIKDGYCAFHQQAKSAPEGAKGAAERK